MLGTYASGQDLPQGYYLKNDTWEVMHVPREGAIAAGEGLKYYRVPFLAVLVGGPLAALVWIAMFPFLTFGFIVYLILRDITGAAWRSLRWLLGSAGLWRRRQDAGRIRPLLEGVDEQAGPDYP